jgi:ComF family protein
MLAQTLEDNRISALPRKAWALVPVPLYHARQREREYNQAWELCRVVSSLTGILSVDALVRAQATTSQASLTRNQRLENLRGVFRVKRPWFRKTPLLKGKPNILLVDDVLTTGSTTSECARVLRRDAGVEMVVVLTVARG